MRERVLIQQLQTKDPIALRKLIDSYQCYVSAIIRNVGRGALTENDIEGITAVAVLAGGTITAGAVFLKDGTVLATEFGMFDDVPKDQSGAYVLEGTRYKEFAYSYGTTSAGNVVCDGTEHFNEYLIYQAE